MEYRELKKLLGNRLALKAVKTFRGMDGVGLNADLWFDGKKVAFCMDEGCGGEMRIDFYPHDEKEAEVEAFVKSLGIPAEHVVIDAKHSIDMEYDLEHIVNTIVDGMEEERQLRRKCKTKTLTRLTNGKVISWNRIFSPEVKKMIQSKEPELLKDYGADIAAFVNEEMGC